MEGRAEIVRFRLKDPALRFRFTIMFCSGPAIVRVMAVVAGMASAIAAENDGFLQTSGTVLRDQHGKGKVVALRGVNLGAWLEWQSWMCPVDSSKTLRDANPGHNGYDFEVRRLLEKRFGAATADGLVRTYEESWITSRDLDQIRSLGLNAVRLPFGYATLLHEDGTWRKDAFGRMDWCVAEAWKRGIYSIVDFHAFLPPGADQDGGPKGYWASEPQMAETVRIWRRIAGHYKGNPAVAFYDLLNEPNNSALHHQPGPDARQICDLYDRLYKAIREVDPDHAIAMEGVWDWKTLRDPQKAGYQNVIYSFHWYNWGAKNTAERNQSTDRDIATAHEIFRTWNVPVFIGEFNLFGDRDAWKYALAAYDKAGLNWTMWNYKHKDSGTNSWGLCTAIKGGVPAVPNLTTDSAEAIRANWKAWASTPRSYRLNPMFEGIIGPAAK